MKTNKQLIQGIADQCAVTNKAKETYYAQEVKLEALLSDVGSNFSALHAIGEGDVVTPCGHLIRKQPNSGKLVVFKVNLLCNISESPAIVEPNNE